MCLADRPASAVCRSLSPATVRWQRVDHHGLAAFGGGVGIDHLALLFPCRLGLVGSAGNPMGSYRREIPVLLGGTPPASLAQAGYPRHLAIPGFVQSGGSAKSRPC
jgi:hypothetical protein